MELKTLSIILFFRSILADVHQECQCTINGAADNGLTYAGALLYADSVGWSGLNNTCTGNTEGVVISWEYNPTWVVACDDNEGIDGDTIATACSNAYYNVASATAGGWSNCN